MHSLGWEDAFANKLLILKSLKTWVQDTDTEGKHLYTHETQALRAEQNRDRQIPPV